MNILSESLSELQKGFQTLPGIGEKTAQRLAYFIVNQPPERAIKLSNAIKNAIDRCKPCSTCFLLSDTNPCNICRDDSRTNETLCIVESSKDVFLIENTREFNGKYFVLGNLLSPIDGIGPNEIRVNELNDLLNKYDFKEIILAISPSTEGETTIHYLANHLNLSNVKITRLSTGLPFGGDMEYTGSTTLLNAIKRRFPVQ